MASLLPLQRNVKDGRYYDHRHGAVVTCWETKLFGILRLYPAMYGRSRVKTWSSCDNGRCHYVKAPCGTLSLALTWAEASSNACCNYKVSMLWWIDSLSHLTATFILKTTRHRTYGLIVFMRGNHAMANLCANLISSCIINARQPSG
jgi:hypothetical protein